MYNYWKRTNMYISPVCQNTNLKETTATEVTLCTYLSTAMILVMAVISKETCHIPTSFVGVFPGERCPPQYYGMRNVLPICRSNTILTYFCVTNNILAKLPFKLFFLPVKLSTKTQVHSFVKQYLYLY